MIKNSLIVFSLSVFISACSNSMKLQPYAQNDLGGESQGIQFSTDEGYHKIKTNRPTKVVTDQVLANIYRKWSGTRYRMGGTTKRGIDCSAFMQAIFLEAYGINLPRSTSEQRFLGKKIAKYTLQKGDLVFFRKNHHVGVYIGNNQFMHASSSQGVTISSLDEAYWLRTYTQSRRIM
ncbi:NlpC/P60 family protein [Rodentibacter caecimuris]|uniref:Endopeptidase n=1 Tax=Rodentibacter caecimuris TaxID=1796644 RepID=A0ABX3KWI1_9PAST|nr:endopeptidase [Rodentibacter heylii]